MQEKVYALNIDSKPCSVPLLQLLRVIPAKVRVMSYPCQLELALKMSFRYVLRQAKNLIPVTHVSVLSRLPSRC
jgi:hypothetical protein